MLHLVRMTRAFAVIVFALLAGLRVTWADSGVPAAATILVGESFKFTLTSNFSSGNQYDTGASDVLTVAVAPNPLPTGPSCTWTVTGVAPGISHRSFTWYNPAHGYESGFFNCPVTVLAKGSSSGNDGGSVVEGGDPVNMRNGELFGLENVDLNLGGPLPLRLERYYASAIAADGKVSSALGTNRAHNFDVTLQTDGTTVATVTTSRGRVVTFSGKLGKWTLVLPTDIPYQLVKSGLNYRFADPASKRQFVFDASGKLTSIEDGRGNALTLTYTGALLTSVSDGLGRNLTFSYTGTSLTSVSDGTRNVAFTYSGNNIATATDPAGHTTTYAYDANNFLTSVTRPLGNVPISQIFTGGKVTTQTQRGANTTFAYGSGTTTETDPTSATQTYGFAVSGTPTSIMDAAGKSLTMGHDATGHWNSVTDRLGRTTTIAFHTPSGLVASVTRPDGGTTSNLYTPRHLTTGLTFYDRAKITYPDASIQTFTHDASGNLLQSNDALGHITRYTYNTRGQPVTITNALGGVTTFTYDLAGRPASRKDSDTLPDNFTYNAFSKLLQIAHSDNSTRNFSYSTTGLLTSETDELGGITTLAYDDNNRLTGVTDALGHTASAVYDTADTPVSFTDRRGKTRAQTYDTRSLVVSGTDPMLNATTFDYDPRRRLTKVTDPLSNQTTLGYDDEARLTSIADPLNHTTTFARDVLGRVTAASDALGHTTLSTHDLRLRPTVNADALGRQTHWTYDKGGRLIAAARDGLPAAAYTRDALGDVTQIKDPNGGLWKYTYTKMGRLASATDPLLHKTSYAYDSRGRVITITHPDGGTATISYNSVSRVTGLVGGDGTSMGFGYDVDNRLISATTGTAGNDVALTLDEDGNITNSAQDGFNFGATYDDDGRLSSLDYIGVYTVNYTYDAAGRLASVSDTFTGGTVGLTYDAAGRPATITRPNGVTTMFTFDKANRLTELKHGTIIDLKYTLNAANEVAACDMTAPLTPSVALAAKTFKFDKASQIVSAAGTDPLPASGNFAYDTRGRLITSPAYGFSWDALSRLKTIADPAANANDRAYTYDAFGTTVTRSVGPIGTPTAVTRYFHHHALSGAPVVAERDEVGNAFLRSYVYTPDGQLLYSLDANVPAARFYHADRNGNVLAITDGATGTVTDSYAYGLYGEMLARSGTSTQPFRWQGAWSVRTDVIGTPGSENAASVFYDVHVRWLDPATARFLSRDPAGPKLADVRALDPYQYALGDPATYIDRTGADAVEGGSTNRPNNQPGGVSAGAPPNIGGVELHIFAPGSYQLSLNFPPFPNSGSSAFLNDSISLESAESADLRNLFDVSLDLTAGKLEIGASSDFGLEQGPETFDEERQKSRYLWIGVAAYLKDTLSDAMYFQARLYQPTNASTLIDKATSVTAGSTAAGTGNAEGTFAYQFMKGVWMVPEARIDLDLQNSTTIATATANAAGTYNFDNIEEGVTYRIAPADLSLIFDRPN